MDLIVFEVGLRNPVGKYSKFMESQDRDKVNEYIEIMRSSIDDYFEIVFLEKDYKLVSTTPLIIKK